MFIRLTEFFCRSSVSFQARVYFIFAAAFFSGASLRAAYSWSNVAVGGGGYVSGLVYHPTERNLLYARTDVGGAYRWSEPAARWVPLNDDIGGLNNEFMNLGVLSIAVDPADSRLVYLACGQYVRSWAPDARLLRSSNQGATWTQVVLPFKLAGNDKGRGTGERLSVDPHNPSRLLIGTSADGLWQSSNRGSTWTRVSSFTPEAATFVLHDRKNRGVVYAGAADLAGKSLWRSLDAGATWSPVPGQPDGLMALQGKLDATGTLYLAFSNGLGPNGITAGAVWKLAKSAGPITAANWININPPAGQGGYCGLALDPQRPGVVMAATINRWYPRDEIFLSTNGGSTWKGILAEAPLDISKYPWSASFKPHWITDVEIDPFNSNRVSFVTGFGVFTAKTVYNGNKPPVWTFSGAGLEETVPTGLVSPAEGPPLISTIADFDGFRHDRLDTPPVLRHAPFHGGNRMLEGAGKAPAVLVRLHRSGSLSRDGGTTWKDFPATPPAVADGAGSIALSADGKRLLWCPPDSTPFWSADDGASWTASTGAGEGALMPAADRVKATDFYVCDPSQRLLFRSTDGGMSFAPVSSDLPSGVKKLAAMPGVAGELWASADGDGFFRLVNGGTKITRVKKVEACYSFGFGKGRTADAPPSVFFWGTIGGQPGVYRSDDAGLAWVRINDAKHQFGRIGCITGDARVYGRVYLGTSGRGIIVGELR